jgi:hypothetical protein
MNEQELGVMQAHLVSFAAGRMLGKAMGAMCRGSQENIAGTNVVSEI